MTKYQLESYPACLNADHLTEILGISRAGAYRLMHQTSFPTLHIGRRMVVPKEKLILWIDQNSTFQNHGDSNDLK